MNATEMHGVCVYAQQRGNRQRERGQHRGKEMLEIKTKNRKEMHLNVCVFVCA